MRWIAEDVGHKGLNMSWMFVLSASVGTRLLSGYLENI